MRGGGAVDERYVTLGGCTVQRYEALQGGVKFSGKKRYVTLECPYGYTIKLHTSLYIWHLCIGCAAGVKTSASIE